MAEGQSSYSSNSGTTYFDLTTETGDRAEINDALFFQNKPDDSSGTGLIQAIVRVQDPGNGDGFENGYNTSFRPLSYEENTSPNFTTSLVLNSVPIVTIDGVQYYEFRLDINQLSSSSLLSLDALKIYTSDVSDGQAEGLITGTWFTDNATLRYDLDGDGDSSVLLDATLSSGSGSSDMFFYVPVSNFGGVDPDVTYVTLYSEFGDADTLDGADGITPLDDPANTALEDDGSDTGDVATAIYGSYLANDGFEEWSVSKQTGGVISGYKFADLNGNGEWDDGETGLAGWTINYTITYESGKGSNAQTVELQGSVVTSDGTTDVDGDGDIDPAGFYTIFVPASTDKKETYSITLTEVGQTDFVNTWDGDATPNLTTTFTFSGDDLTLDGSPNISGQFEETDQMNFGNFEKFDISGTKYTDITGDGLSGDDTVLGGVTIFIDVNGNDLDDDGYSTVTAGDGTWEFLDLDYTVAGAEVKEITPTGYIQTVGQAGTVTDTNYVITGTSGTDQEDLDFANFLPDPKIDIEKSVKTNLFDYLPEDGDDDPDGLLAATNSTVTFKLVVTNTGNETLSDITLSDSVVHTVNGVQTSQDIVYTPDGDGTTLDAFDVFVDLNGNTVEDAGEAWSNFDTDGDGVIDAGEIAELSPNETFTLYYSLNSLLGQHENTGGVEAVSAISSTTVSDSDDANYYVVEEDCVGVRTPGFWQNSKWALFWNLDANNPGNTATDQDALPQAGEPNFPGGELLYAIDTNEDGFVNAIDGDGINDDKDLDANASGLLIGDYNKNGITDDDEDTIFISLADAKALINASNKNIGDGKTADGIWMLGRDVVATWLNYLANNPDDSVGNCIGEVDGATSSPMEYLDAAIDWLQQFASDANSNNPNTNLNTSFHDDEFQAKFQFDAKISPSSGAWQNPFMVGEAIPVSAAAMHSALDGFNNTGVINGIEYCCDADSELALSALSQISLI